VNNTAATSASPRFTRSEKISTQSEIAMRLLFGKIPSIMPSVKPAASWRGESLETSASIVRRSGATK
jgi:hypothetical protein